MPIDDADLSLVCFGRIKVFVEPPMRPIVSLAAAALSSPHVCTVHTVQPQNWRTQLFHPFSNR